jgi:putative endonuclease
MANRYRGGMHVGKTADLPRRFHQHRAGTGSLHVADFNKTRLVHVEHYDMIAREKRVKTCKRDWKFALIRAANPQGRDL